MAERNCHPNSIFQRPARRRAGVYRNAIPAASARCSVGDRRDHHHCRRSAVHALESATPRLLPGRPSVRPRTRNAFWQRLSARPEPRSALQLLLCQPDGNSPGSRRHGPALDDSRHRSDHGRTPRASRSARRASDWRGCCCRWCAPDRKDDEARVNFPVHRRFNSRAGYRLRSGAFSLAHCRRPLGQIASASRICRHSGITLVFKTTSEVFTRAGPDNSLERLTERSVGLVTDRSSNVHELFVTLL